MITRDPAELRPFFDPALPPFGPATARAAFLVAPEGFARAEQSAGDNRYMAAADAFDAASALAEHRALQAALSADLPVIAFPGDAATPDAVFPNNVFATAAPGRSIIGRMRHPVRRREAERADIRGFLRDVLGCGEIDLSGQPHPCELTGSLVIDRLHGIGYCGLSERCDEAGARLMHEAFGLRATLVFDLAEGEYHANVVLAVLAGRAALVMPDGFADPAVALGVGALYAPHAVWLDRQEQAAFCANAIALASDRAWMSARAADALAPVHALQLERAGFRIGAVPLAAIEAGGGSLRCCVAEVF